MRSNEEVRLTARPSPPEHASNKRDGHRRKGNNGLMYEVKSNAAGVKQWKLTSAAKEFARACKETPFIRLELRPGIEAMFQDKKEVRDDHKAFSSQRALSIVWDSATTLAMCLEGKAYIESVLWNKETGSYIVDLRATKDTSLGTVLDEVKTVYEDAAEDTWMEGDIEVLPGRELTLGVVSCKHVV